MAALLLTISCNKALFIDCETYDYSDCETAEPFDGKLVISVLHNEEYPRIPIVVYEGYYEDNNVIFTDTLTDGKATYTMPVDKYYSATAVYRTNQGKVIAVDGESITRKSIYKCDSLCWEVKDAHINLILKEF